MYKFFVHVAPLELKTMKTQRSHEKRFLIKLPNLWRTAPNGVKPPADTPALEPYDYLDDALKQAELSLKYAAEKGIHIDPDIRNSIFQAGTARSNGWNDSTAANVLSALTALAAQVTPVTGKSLQSSEKRDASWVLYCYYLVALLLALVIGPFSVAAFVASGLSSDIRTGIATGNDLAVKLTVQLGPLPDASEQVVSVLIPPSVPASSTFTPSQSGAPTGDKIEVITELQQFASTIRAIDARAQQLNLLVCLLPKSNRIPDPFGGIRPDKGRMHTIFELPDGLPNFAQAASDRIRVYKEVRYFAQNILDEVSLGYGAINACILPVLYALLGACAYLLRSLKKHIRNQTYMPHYANSARFIVAAIGGAVVGLFNNFSITQVPSISPLAIAFLVGYAVDVFYAFLDGLLKNFIKNGLVPPASVPPLPAPAKKKSSQKSSDPPRTE